MMVNLGPLGPMMQKPITVRYREMDDGTYAQVVAPQVPISQEAAERIRDEFNAEYGRSHYSNPIILDSGTSSIGKPHQAHHAFICVYCGRASQSVEPCQGCGALRTREQLELWARMGL